MAAIVTTDIGFEFSNFVLKTEFLWHLPLVNEIFVINIKVYFFPINLDNELVGETKLIFKEIFNELTSSCHCFVLCAVFCVKEEFMSNQVVGAV